MIKRFVKLTFEQDKTENFIEIFAQSKDFIRNTEGCLHLELLRDAKEVNIFFTLSHWADENALEKYRQSELFRTIWTKLKVMFDDKPEAWTTVVITD